MAEVLPEIKVTDSPIKDGGLQDSSPAPSPTKDGTYRFGDGRVKTGSSSEGTSLRRNPSTHAVKLQTGRGAEMDNVNNVA